MKKKTIIYCLTSRGLYSELFNLTLAQVYAKHYHFNLKLNTYLWNARIEKGWEDYFEPTLECVNSRLSAQDKIYTKERIWIGNIYYNPKAFFSFYSQATLNFIYHLLHPTHIFAKNVFEKMRSDEFINQVLGEDAFAVMTTSFKNIYKINQAISCVLDERIQQLHIPNNYIGVHIRRGDKIVTKEMQDIKLNQYIEAILAHQHISNNVYIATDDTSVIPYIQEQLSVKGFQVFYNHQNHNHGFDEFTYNNSSRASRYEDMLNVLLDMEILIKSTFFIGTYTSNLSRVVPFFLGHDKCLSLDNDWNIINSLNNN